MLGHNSKAGQDIFRIAEIHAVALHHSFWCLSAGHLLMSSVTDLFEIPITGSRPVGFCFVASLASKYILCLVALDTPVSRSPEDYDLVVFR